MAYTTINKSTANFDTNLYQANGSGKTISGMDFEPGMIWTKNRDNSSYIHAIVDQVRGGTKKLFPNDTGSGVGTDANAVTAFNSDGYTFGSSGSFNYSTNNYVNWCFNAGGSAPTQTYTVKVVSDGGNKYRFDDYGTSAVTLDLQEGGTYTFDVSDSSMNSHPFVIGTAANGTEYSTGVTYKLDGVTKTYSQYTSGFSSASSRQLIFTVPASAPALYYWCSVHSGMGGAINTNDTHGSSNFSGAVQATVSANTTAGFSVVKWTGTNGASTVGHGLGVAPKFIIIRRLAASTTVVYHESLGNTKRLALDDPGTPSTNSSFFNNTSPTTTTFAVGSDAGSNGSTDGYVAYCFAEKTGYCKISKYHGNGSSDGTFVNTGFKPTLVLYKNISQNDEWFVKDSKRPLNQNPTDLMFWSADNAETSLDRLNIFSNGFKLTTTDKGANTDGNEYVYLAIGQSIVGSNNIPATAR